MTDSELAHALKEWGMRVGRAGSGVRRKSPVWVAMREVLGVFGNWRNAPRGNPRKGYVAMRMVRE